MEFVGEMVEDVVRNDVVKVVIVNFISVFVVMNGINGIIIDDLI